MIKEQIAKVRDVHVYGIWWIGVYMVANPNSTFAP
jgi:hypothetical protein